MRSNKICSYALMLFIFLTVYLPTYSSYSQGVISGGGGGDFDLALFWSYVRSIKSEMTPQRIRSDILRLEDLEKLKELMNPQISNVKMSDELLFVLNEKGERVSVGAVNIPDKKEILLQRTIWRNHYLSQLEIRHLILHEFLGLLRIDDTGYKISEKIFSPERSVLQFEVNAVGCSLHTWVMLKINNSIEIRSMYPEGAGSSGNLNLTFGQILERPTGRARLPRKFKTATSSNKLKTSWAHDAQSDPKLPQMSYELNYTLENSFQTNGRFGASGAHFGHPPSASVHLTMFSQVPGETKKIRGMQSWTFDSRNMAREINVGVSLIDNSLSQRLMDLNIPLRLSQNSTHQSDRGASDIENFVALMLDWAETQGAKTMTEADALISEHILKPLGGISPILTNVSCN